MLFLLTAFHLASVRKNAWFALSNISADAPRRAQRRYLAAHDILALRLEFQKISIGSQTSDSGSQDFVFHFGEIYVEDWCGAYAIL